MPSRCSSGVRELPAPTVPGAEPTERTMPSSNLERGPYGCMPAPGIFIPSGTSGGAACAVFPSRYEGFGLPVLEALACGTPLVTTTSSSLPELAGDAAFAVDPEDNAALAGAILACLVDESLVAELRQRGPAQAAHFRWADTARQTLAVYDKAAAGTGE